MTTYWLIFVWGDVEPELHGPFPTELERDNFAKYVRETEGNRHGFYPMTVTDGIPDVRSYSGAFFPD